MPEDDFHTKEHITKHLTAAQYDVIRERTRVNSWAEQDYLNWMEFLARTLTIEKLTPFTYDMIMKSTSKYGKAYGSYSFGIVQRLGKKWIWIILGVVAAVVVFMYFSGAIVIGGR